MPESDNPLDHTGVHPESYPALEKIAGKLQKGMKDLTGDGSAQTMIAGAKPRADAMLLAIYNQYMDSRLLLQDTPCA